MKDKGNLWKREKGLLMTFLALKEGKKSDIFRTTDGPLL